MPVVKIKQGFLKGGTSQTVNGTPYYEFLEIPYAKPPTGELRFKSPELPDPWVGERISTSASKKPIQFNSWKNKIEGTEDCLYLNVFTPRISSSEFKLLPVMVYIHGGGFILGNGTIKEEGGPDYFLNEEVVLVFINYRLHVFGFLSLDIPEAAGNMGLKDQIMVLNWVQHNIDQFGGDKTNVTLFGISAGAASIEYLMLAPQAQDLFHKAIIQSGSSLNHWAISNDAKGSAYKLAQELGFEGSNIDYLGIYKFVSMQSAEKIQTAFGKLLNTNTGLRLLSFGFVPCVEKDFGNNDAILTETPYTLLKKGKFNKVPVIRGFCDTEGFLTKITNPLIYKTLSDSKIFTQHWPYAIKEIDFNGKLKGAYLKENNTNFALNFFNDFDFVSGIWISSEYMVKECLTVYMYEFSYEGEANFAKKLFQIHEKGTSHGDDTTYIIKVPTYDIKSESDILIRDRFIKMWTNFAKFGNPTPQTDSLTPIKWPTFNKESQVYLNIDKELTLKSNYEPLRMELFREIYDKYKM